MPLFDYKCEKCGKEFEERVSLSEYDTKKIKCPDCGEEAKRLISAQRSTHTSWKTWRL